MAHLESWGTVVVVITHEITAVHASGSSMVFHTRVRIVEVLESGSSGVLYTRF